MDTSKLAAILDTSIKDLQSALDELKAAPPPAPPMPVPVPPAPPPKPPEPPKPAPGLARVQSWLIPGHLGVYISPFHEINQVRSALWRAPQFASLAVQLAAWGVDFMLIKTGEWGVEWYDGQFSQIRQACLEHGMGVCGYHFCRPEHWREDAAICAKIARQSQGIFLDCEEQFLGHHDELKALVETVRSGAPESCIIVTGYGAPDSAFNGKWPFDAIAQADAYQPQTYFTSPWTEYLQHGALAAINWGMNQVANEFTKYGLGLNYCIQPCISLGMRNFADYQIAARRCKDWQAALCVWEAQGLTADIARALKAGLA